MKIAIIGLANSGKTTVFNALTRGSAETAGYSSGRLEPNLGNVKVPDPRLSILVDMYHPRKITPAEVHYVDIGGFGGTEGRKDGLPPELLNFISSADAFIHVVRDFESSEVAHPSGSVDPLRDAAVLDLELIFSDLAIIERRLERLDKEISKLPLRDRPARSVERDLLARLQAELMEETPLRDVPLSEAEEKMLRGYQFLSAKPTLVLVNLDESRISSPRPFEYRHQSTEVVSLSAKVEAELAQLEDAEAAEFLQDLGIEAPARDRVIAASYRLLGLISFLTVGEDEVRAWTIRKGMNAQEAGGSIHSDIQRGFIRAEIISYEDLIAAGSMAEARKRGTLRLEGKQYIVQDGDICNFLFNV